MKYLLILSYLLFTSVSWVSYSFAYDIEIKGNLSCKVKSVYILEMVDGKPKTYSGWTGGINVNSTLYFNYEYIGYSSVRKITIKSDHWEDLKFRFLSQSKFRKKDSSDRDDMPNVYFGYSASGLNATLTGENLWFDGTMRILSLQRYYKNDWHGVLVRNDASSGDNIISLDCRNPGNSLDEILKDLRNNGY